jgi:hypothetical protein
MGLSREPLYPTFHQFHCLAAAWLLQSGWVDLLCFSHWDFDQTFVVMYGIHYDSILFFGGLLRLGFHVMLFFDGIQLPTDHFSDLSLV